MPTTTQISADIKLNLEGDWPRESYRRLCAERGVAYDEQDYLRWRAIGERLTGRLSFETQAQRCAEAFQRLGLSMAQAGHALQKALAGIQWHE